MLCPKASTAGRGVEVVGRRAGRQRRQPVPCQRLAWSAHTAPTRGIPRWRQPLTQAVPRDADNGALAGREAAGAVGLLPQLGNDPAVRGGRARGMRVKSTAAGARARCAHTPSQPSRQLAARPQVSLAGHRQLCSPTQRHSRAGMDAALDARRAAVAPQQLHLVHARQIQGQRSSHHALALVAVPAAACARGDEGESVSRPHGSGSELLTHGNEPLPAAATCTHEDGRPHGICGRSAPPPPPARCSPGRRWPRASSRKAC